MDKFMRISDIVEENGKTIKENNLEKKHNIPVNSLVEVKFNEWFGKGACQKVHGRFFIYAHTRDCDGTPLYTLSENQYEDGIESLYVKTLINLNKILVKNNFTKKYTGFTEESLTVIERNENIDNGLGKLEWDED